MENYVNQFASIHKIIDEISTLGSEEERRAHLNFINDKIQELQTAAEKKLKSKFKKSLEEMKNIKIDYI